MSRLMTDIWTKTTNLNDSDLVAYSHGEYFTLGEKIGTFGYSVRKK